MSSVLQEVLLSRYIMKEEVSISVFANKSLIFLTYRLMQESSQSYVMDCHKEVIEKFVCICNVGMQMMVIDIIDQLTMN